MKLFALLLLGSKAKKIKPPVGCDPAWLGEYEITEDCKRDRGFNTVPDENGVLLEMKSNWCRRKCKYGESLPETTYTMCKCKPDWTTGVRVFNCWYQIKLAKTVKGWVPFNHTINDAYPLDKWGEGGKQASCVLPTQVGTWGEWSEFGPCDATCGLGERKRTRQCSSDYCGDEPSVESMKCLGYSDYALNNPHSCDNAKDWWQPHAMGNPFTWLNEGTHCIFPSFGRGWTSETIDGEVVEMGVECESGWNYDTHSIAPLNGNCKLVCRGSNGGDYLPKTSHWSNLQCLSPITVQWLDPSKSHGINDWMSQGLGMDFGLGEPWYFNRQNWPRTGCWPGCGTHKTLSDTAGIVNKCYKVGSEPKCSDTPPLTDFEIKHNTATNAISWQCTDGNQPGSTCTKSCVNNHLDHIGNPNQICVCQGETCEWERTGEYFHYAVYRDRPKSCIKGCDAQPDTMWPDKQYKLDCSDQEDLIEWSDSIDGDAIRYQWNHPTPVTVNNKCTVKCDDYSPINGYPREWQMEDWAETGGINGGIDEFDIQCKRKSDGSGFEWVGDFKECIQVCTPITTYNTGDEWTCTNDFFIGSTCTKRCLPGFKFDKTNASWKKTSTRCRKKSYGTSWSNTHFKDCVPE